MSLHSSAPAAAESDAPNDVTGGRRRGVWNTFVAAIGAIFGLAPHVLHHVGSLVGAAVISGATGTVLFGAIGLVASIPILIRLHRRFASLWAPVIALAMFALMFTLSSLVIGPALRGDHAPGHQPTGEMDQKQHNMHDMNH